MILRLGARAGPSDFGAVSKASPGDRMSDADAVLWYALADGMTRMELVDRLLEKYPSARGHAESRADDFVTALRRRGLLVES